MVVLCSWDASEVVRGYHLVQHCSQSTCHALCQALGIQGKRETQSLPHTEDMIAAHVSC